MAWIGYNTQSEVESIIKLNGNDKRFTTSSSSLTIMEVERFNLLAYNYINNSLRGKGITVPVTDENDILELSLINTYLTSEIIENIRHKILEGKDNSLYGKKIGDAGRALLQRFVSGKGFLSENTTQTGFTNKIGLVYTDIKDEDPKFKMDYKW